MNNKEKETIKTVQEQFGKKNIDFFDRINQSLTVISSGSLQIDQLLGIGGIPKGRIIEIYGNESSGKTTVAITIASTWQKHGMKVAYIDAEKSLDGHYLKTLKINLNELVFAQPSSGEQAFSIIEALIKSEIIDLIIVDSVAALMPQAEMLMKIDDQNIGMHARLMSRGLRRIQAIMHQNSASVIFVNQLRDKIGINFGNFETTTGGRALRFYSSIRIELKRLEILKNTKEKYGIKSKVTITKNKLSSPFKSKCINILFNSGIDNTTEEIEFALEQRIITQSGSWYNHKEIRLCQGRENLWKMWTESKNKRIENIKKELLARLNRTVVEPEAEKKARFNKSHN